MDKGAIPPSSGPVISRRGFLAAGSLAAAAPLLGGWRAPLSAATSISRLSIGYVVGSADLLDRPPPLLGDPRFVRLVGPSAADGPSVNGPARVTVRGIYPEESLPARTRSVDLEVNLARWREEESLPVYLWSLQREPVLSVAAPAGLNIPSRTPLRLQLTVTGSGDPYVARGRLGTSALPFHRGIYLIGLSPWWRRRAHRPSLMLSVDAQN